MLTATAAISGAYVALHDALSAIQRYTNPGGNEHILLVEDEAMVRELGRDTLEEAGYHVLDAGAHRMARESLGIGNHDLVSLGAENRAQCVDLGRRAAATCGRVGLV